MTTTSVSLADPGAAGAALPGWLSMLPVSHLRLGSCTCAQLLPGDDALQAALDLARQRGYGVELSTPTLTDADLPRVLEVVDRMAGSGVEAVVVINDLGLLHRMAGRADVRLVAGRLLHRQQRDPRLAGVRPGQLGVDRWPASWVVGSAASPSWLTWIRSTGITRVEIDLPPVGDPGGYVAADLPRTLHLPWSVVAVGRRCRDVPLEPDGCAAPCLTRGLEVAMDLPGETPATVRLLQQGKAEWSSPGADQLEVARRWLSSAHGPDRVVWREMP